MDYDERALKLANKIEKHYEHHAVPIEIKSYQVIGNGERYIFDVKLLKGTRQSLFFSRAKDIQLALKLPLFHPYKEGLSICIAVSEEEAVENSLLKIIKSPVFNKSNLKIPYAYGYDIKGTECVLDLATLPHLLIGGSTNSGKSVALRCLITSIIIKQNANRVNLLLFDIGASDLAVFSEIPHLSHPIIKDADTGIKVMLALLNEMERRITLEQNELRKLPAIVCIVDEFVSFISNINNKRDSKLLTEAISNLLRRGRHARIHMVLATQDPTKESVKVDLGNITARIAFACAKPQHSTTILGVGGAEKLTAKGTLLLKSSEHPDPQYIQGSFIKTNDIKLLFHNIPKGYACPYKFEIIEPYIILVGSDERNKLMNPASLKLNEDDELLAKIIIWSLKRNSISCKLIEDTFRLGYRRANKFLEQMRQLNIAGDMYAKLPRAVLPSSFEDLSSETINLLNRNGYREDDLADIFKAKRQALDNSIVKSAIVHIENNASHNETKADDNITIRTSTIHEKGEARVINKKQRQNSSNPQRKHLINRPHKSIDKILSEKINKLNKQCEMR